MFGFLKKIENKIGKKTYTVHGNDGKNYFYDCMGNTALPQIKINDRVKFLSGARCSISNIFPLKSVPERGRVIRTGAKHGLIELSSGEIVEYSCIDNALEPYQQAEVLPGPAASKKSAYASCKIIKLYYPAPVTDDIRKKVSSLLENNFGSDRRQKIDDVIELLKQNGISLTDFGYSDKQLFLEQFPLIMHLCEDNENVLIIDKNDISQYYDKAYGLLKKQGYENMTLLQQRVFSDKGFWNNSRNLILGSTSSGKTAVGLAKFLLQMEQSSEKPKLLIAVNLRTLTAQFQSVIEKRLKFHDDLTVAISTSEYISNDTDIIKGNFDISIVIYEKLFIFSSIYKDFFRKYTHLLIDEAAIVSDPERGAKVDVILSNACKFPDLNITVLGTPYYEWERYINKYELYPVRMYSRPAPVHEYFIYPVKNDRDSLSYVFADSEARTIVTNAPENWENTLFKICYEEYTADRKVIVFFNSQRRTREYSSKFYQYLNKNGKSQEIQQFIERFVKKYDISFEELKGYFDTEEEYEALYYGIAFHNASLPEKMRIAIETEFLGAPDIINNGMRIVFSTDTLAYGINSNADTVIMTSMDFYTVEGYKKISFNTYQNCIGRAGRLGYRSYGKSYAFFGRDFEKNYFKDAPDHTELPKKAIEFYTNAGRRSSESICGTLGDIIEEHDTDRLAFYVLSLFPKERPIAEAEINDQLFQIPKPYEIDKNELSEITNNSLCLLEENKLIRSGQDSCIYDELEEPDGYDKKYRITDLGKNLCGFAISVESFKKICSMPESLIQDNEIYVFDYFSELTNIKEFLGTLKLDPEQKERPLSENQIKETYSLIEYMLPVFDSSKMISKSKFTEISAFISQAKKWQSLSDKKLYQLLTIRASTIITMWISGYNIQMISEVLGIEEQHIDNIRRKYGERVSYYTDILNAIAKHRGYEPEILKKISQLSLSLFYGICYEWLTEDDIELLSLEQANKYHIASMCVKRYDLIRSLGDTEALAQLEKEFKLLDRDTRKLLKEKGVEIDG